MHDRNSLTRPSMMMRATIVTIAAALIQQYVRPMFVYNRWRDGFPCSEAHFIVVSVMPSLRAYISEEPL